MQIKPILSFALASIVLVSCGKNHEQNTVETVKEVAQKVTEKKFDYNVEQFADIKILRYQIPGFD